MLTAAEANKKFQDVIEEYISKSIEKACEKFIRSVDITFPGTEAIDYISGTVVQKLKDTGYKVEVVENRSGGILTSTSSNGEPSIQLTISW